MIVPGKRWIWPPGAAREAERLCRELGVAPALARVLVNRGLKGPAEARAFLDPSPEQLHSPWLMEGMEEAVRRITLALERGEKITVHGDYDADGITAAALLVEALRALGGRAEYYLPSRFEEGYGLHREALEKIRAAGTDLVVTVDCGINAAAETAYARTLGLEIIITDHHRPLEQPVGAAAVLNPHRPGCGYPFKELSGAGIAFKLATALAERGGVSFPQELLDLAALGTVADVVPLLGENRVLVSAGLKEINLLKRAGLRALAGAAGLRGELRSFDLAFILAPSLNAAGRLGDAGPAAQLLLAENEAEARRLAEHLRRENRLRRETELQILREAEAAVIADPAAAGEYIITLAREGWHHGVIGIVASRLVERFYRPVVLIALEGGEGRGSARSIPGFDITAALAGAAPLLARFGGHAQAAGLTVPASRVGELRERLNRYAASRLGEDDLVPRLRLEGELAGEEIDLALARQLSRLEPFGTGNPVPAFFSRGWDLRSWRLAGKEKEHLKLDLVKEKRSLAPILFSGASLVPRLRCARRLDLAFTLRESAYRGEPVLSVELKDIAESGCGLHGRVAVADWRGEAGRPDQFRQIVSGAGRAAVFAGTRERREKIEARLPAEAEVVLLAGGNNRVQPGLSGDCADLVLYDLPLAERYLDPFFAACPREGEIRIYLLYDRADRERNRLLLDLALPSPELLEEIYRALAETAAAGSDVTFPGPAAERFSPAPGEGFWRRCREIFTETGLLRSEGLSLFRLEPGASNWLERLERSAAFRAARELRESCEQFQEMLLSASAAELARYWHAKLPGGSGGAE